MDVSTKRAVGTGLMSLRAWRVSKDWRRAGRVCLDTAWGERDILDWMEGEGEVWLDAAHLARSVNYS